jgi:hypothetical protein
MSRLRCRRVGPMLRANRKAEAVQPFRLTFSLNLFIDLLKSIRELKDRLRNVIELVVRMPRFLDSYRIFLGLFRAHFGLASASASHRSRRPPALWHPTVIRCLPQGYC